MHDVEKMYTYVKGFAMGAKLENTLNAMYFARKKHENQKRNGGEPYIVHPLSMACMAVSLGIRDDIILAAIMLHDVVEDCNVDLKDLPVSQEVKDVVNLVTFKLEPGRTKEVEKKIYFENIAKSTPAMIVKLLDRSNNVSTMAGVFKKDRLLSYVKETREKVLPLYRVCKEKSPEYSDALHILKFQIESVLDTIEGSFSYFEAKQD